MAKDPAFLFYPNDYIGGTMGMTFEEKGAYIELLMLQFNRGHMDGHMISHCVGQIWEKIKSKFIQDEQGLWYNERLDIEKAKRKAFSDSRRNNIKGNNQHMIGHMTTHMEDENVNVIEDKNINIDFEWFWNDYDKKVGDKQKLKKSLYCQPLANTWQRSTKVATRLQTSTRLLLNTQHQRKQHCKQLRAMC